MFACCGPASFGSRAFEGAASLCTRSKSTGTAAAATRTAATTAGRRNFIGAEPFQIWQVTTERGRARTRATCPRPETAMSDRGSDCERGGADGATGDAMEDEEPVTLTSLPPELLRHVIDAVGAAPAHMRADGSMSIRMPLALTCRAMWHACVTGALVLRFGGMRLRTDESDPPNAVRHAWSTLIREIGPAGGEEGPLSLALWQLRKSMVRGFEADSQCTK